jgi:phosphatidylserine/phosphatidylglycerophosphate/cardiolipin synthase-like enzyme
MKFKKSQIDELKAVGIEVGVFNFPGFNIFKGVTNFRLHHKALIIDNSVAIYGGSNVGNEYLAMDPKKYY